MDKLSLTNYLHSHIPISQAMGITVFKITEEKLTLKVPFKPNINHKKTAFGGSLHAATTLCCWSMLYQQLDNLDCEIVIMESSTQYLKPVTEDFYVTSTPIDSEKWNRFIKLLRQKKKSKIALSSHIYQNKHLAVQFEGKFAVIINSNT